MTVPRSAVLPARRLVLSRAEWAALTANAGTSLPPDLAGSRDGAPEPGGAELRRAAEELARRRVLARVGDDPAGYRPVAAVATNLGLLGHHQVGVRVAVTLGRHGVRAAYALAGPLGASLFRLADGAVELSLFEARRWGWELLRSVPTVQQLQTDGSRIRQALAGDVGQPLRGVLPLSALAAASGQPPDSDVDSTEAALARAAAARTVGVLRCVVAGRIAGGVGVGQVVWLGTDTGWVGTRPVGPVGGAGHGAGHGPGYGAARAGRTGRLRELGRAVGGPDSGGGR